MTDSIIKTVTVPLSPDRAFKLFTEEMSEWWPLDTHSLSAAEDKPAKSVTIAPKIGGEVTETRHDGTTALWGRVTDWTPGERFGMRWFVGHPEDRATQVDVRFESVADGTQVTLTHSGWAVHGDAATAMRTGYKSGWEAILAGRYLMASKATLVRA